MRWHLDIFCNRDYDSKKLFHAFKKHKIYMKFYEEGMESLQDTGFLSKGKPLG